MPDRAAPLTKEALADQVDRGLTDAEIAASAGVQPRSVANRRTKFGVLRPHSRGPEWSIADDRELRRLFRRGLTDQEIADHLGRTAPLSIQSRRYVLGLLWMHEYPWTEEDDQAFREMWQTSMTAREIASELGRSLGAVTQRRRRLGLEPRTGQEFR